jgi:cytochrome c-type biogenesis protein CcmH
MLSRFAPLVAVFVLLLATAGPAFAVTPDEVLDDPKLETRARELSAGLRCMVCQNQSIDDSDAPLAKDLRILVRERIVAGDTNEEVVDFLVDRYGEFVLLKPRIGWNTILLWALAPATLVIGAIVLLFGARRRTRQIATAGPPRLSEAEQLELEKILEAQAGGREGKTGTAR